MSLEKVILVSVCAICLAQERPAFEVASVKPNAGVPEGSFSFDIAPSGRVTAHNLSVWNLMRSAYSLRNSEISGGPGWIKSRGFDIQAQPVEGKGSIPREQVLQMLQTLLEDRFRLKMAPGIPRASGLRVDRSHQWI